MTGKQYLADLQRLAARDLPDITDTCLRARLRRGWSPRRALEVPQGEWSARRSREVRRRERAVLAVLRDAREPLTRAEVARHAGCTVHAAWRALDQLRARGLVDRSYRSSRSRWWATRQR
jgi:DNA-binding MarR family transcriptional regulator